MRLAHVWALAPPSTVGLYTSSQTSQRLFVMIPTSPRRGRPKFDSSFRNSLYSRSFLDYGQVAQLVERGPEKAGVGGSIPSLATSTFNNLAIAKNVKKLHRAYNTRTSVNRKLKYASQIGSNHFQISRAMRLVLAICRRTSFGSVILMFECPKIFSKLVKIRLSLFAFPKKLIREFRLSIHLLGYSTRCFR